MPSCLPRKLSGSIARCAAGRRRPRPSAPRARRPRRCAIVAEYLRSLDDADLPRRGRSCPAGRSPSATSARPGLGWAAIARPREQVAGSDAAPWAPPTTARPTWARRWATSSRGAGHSRRPATRRSRSPTSRPRSTPSPAARGTRAEAAHPAPGSSSAATRSPPRYLTAILSGRAAHRPARGPPGGRHRRGVRARPGGRPVGRHAHRGHRRDRRAGARRRAGQRPSSTLFHPLKSMLASPVADEAEALARMPPPVWVEDKYDGIRAQLHKQGAEVRLFSRDLHDVSGQFPEVVAAGRRAAVGRHPRRRAAGLARWRGAARSCSSRPGSGARRRRRRSRRRSRSSTSRSTSLALRARASGAVEPLLRLPLRERRARLEALGLDRDARLRAGGPRRPSHDAGRARPASSTAPRSAATRA